jgi:preprotein translocase subunit SecE
MADKKKTTNRNQMAEPRPGTVPKAAPVKATAREERKEQPKKEQSRQESKSTKRDTKGSPNALQRFRNGRIGRFIGEAYYELRHKVTWPTF